MTEPWQRAIARSLALHRAAMGQVARDPRWLERARARVAEWRRTGAVATPYVEAWEEALALPLPELVERVLDPSQAGIDRRQVSPFAGVLAPRERWQILREVERRGDRAAR